MADASVHGITPGVADRSIREAAAAIGWDDRIDADALPAIARRLRDRHRFDAVCVLPLEDASSLAWLDSVHATGWIAPSNEATALSRDVDALSATIAAALEAGFVAADAVMLGFARDRLPRLSFGDEPLFAADAFRDQPLFAHAAFGDDASFARDATTDTDPHRPIGIYAIVDSSDALRRVVDAGVATVQLRIKKPANADTAWSARLRREAEAAIAAAHAGGAELVLNDHWQIAAELGIVSVHLGQEDLVALPAHERAALASSGMRLGVSSHSVWELCRARSLPTRYIACGPVWPTTTKDMPWIAQGPDNLAWWCANAGGAVVAIGGILEPKQAGIAGRCGADGVCLVRALGSDPSRAVPAFADAFAAGRAQHSRSALPAWPHPTLVAT